MSDYFTPETLNDALEWLADGQGRVAAGCTDLFAATSYQNLPGPVVDISGIGELSGIAATSEGWRVGSVTPWSLLRDADLPAAFQGLRQAAAEIGSVQIQNAGTVGGNLCNASPAADGMPALLILDAEVELASVQGRRRLALADFVTGPRQTALRPGELMLGIHIPATVGAGTSAFVKLGARKYMVISIAMAAARVLILDDRVAEIAVAIGACGPVAKRLDALEKALLGRNVREVRARITPALIAPDISPIGDVRADSAYRMDAALQMVQRAVWGAVEAGE